MRSGLQCLLRSFCFVKEVCFSLIAGLLPPQSGNVEQELALLISHGIKLWERTISDLRAAPNRRGSLNIPQYRVIRILNCVIKNHIACFSDVLIKRVEVQITVSIHRRLINGLIGKLKRCSTFRSGRSLIFFISTIKEAPQKLAAEITLFTSGKILPSRK